MPNGDQKSTTVSKSVPDNQDGLNTSKLEEIGIGFVISIVLALIGVHFTKGHNRKQRAYDQRKIERQDVERLNRMSSSLITIDNLNIVMMNPEFIQDLGVHGSTYRAATESLTENSNKLLADINSDIQREVNKLDTSDSKAVMKLRTKISNRVDQIINSPPIK